MALSVDIVYRTDSYTISTYTVRLSRLIFLISTQRKMMVSEKNNLNTYIIFNANYTDYSKNCRSCPPARSRIKHGYIISGNVYHVPNYF